MEGKFFKGVLIGGAIGAAIASKWDVISKNCSILDELKESMPFDRPGQSGQFDHGARAKSKHCTRLMARRHRVRKEC